MLCMEVIVLEFYNYNYTIDLFGGYIEKASEREPPFSGSLPAGGAGSTQKQELSMGFLHGWWGSKH